MKFFLGVDGGQSSTTALIGDETGRVIGTGPGGPCNHATAAEGRSKLENAIRESVGAACAQAGLGAVPRFEAACLGMSGGPEDKRAILESLLDTAHLIVTTDAEIALSGAIESGQGIIVIAGTGSMAFGRNGSGATARAGGWGYVFGDEGSAFDIVRQAVRSTLRMEEGWGPASSLGHVLREATGARNANDLVHRFYEPAWPRDRVAALAPFVDEAARQGDRVAVEILNYSAQQLATLIASVRAQLWKSLDNVDVAYCGGVFRSGILLERFRMLVELDGHTRCGPPLRSAAEGALRQAYRVRREQAGQQ
jgi:N-acetylglucosamine kinase-like BadF-type ATPase